MVVPNSCTFPLVKHVISQIAQLVLLQSEPSTPLLLHSQIPNPIPLSMILEVVLSSSNQIPIDHSKSWCDVLSCSAMIYLLYEYGTSLLFKCGLLLYGVLRSDPDIYP